MPSDDICDLCTSIMIDEKCNCYQYYIDKNNNIAREIISISTSTTCKTCCGCLICMLLMSVTILIILSSFGVISLHFLFIQ